MSNLPVRNIGSAGVITDVAPHNLPAANALSKGNNIRLDRGTVKEALALKTVSAVTGGAFPTRGMFINPTSSVDTLVLVSNTFAIEEYINGVWNTRTHQTRTASELPITTTTLADMNYINRKDSYPIFRSSSGTNFTAITSNSGASADNWNSNWKANSLRKYQGFLLAIGIQEGATDYPYRVRWSTQALMNQQPQSWNAADTTNTAGFNDIVQLTTPLVDGAELGNNFILYSTDQVWMMEFRGGTFVFNFRKLFDDSGIINHNSVVEIQSKHYVFGNKDIYVHDGISKQSICEGRVRDFIFRNIDRNKENACFVHHVTATNEIYFCYPSVDDEAVFTTGERCNKAAVYNLDLDAWCFRDLPNVSAGGQANFSQSITYNGTNPANYDTVGGSYHDAEDGFMRHSVLGGDAIAADNIFDTLYVLDEAETGKVNFPNDTAASRSPVIERQGIDLDEGGLDLRAYKQVTKIYPQMSFENTGNTVSISIGAADLPTSVPSYAQTTSFNPSTSYKVDSRAAGRYLSYKMEMPLFKNFEVSGFDADLIVTGRR